MWTFKLRYGFTAVPMAVVIAPKALQRRLQEMLGAIGDEILKEGQCHVSG